MPRMGFRNTWATAAKDGTGVDQQRADLFQVMLQFPRIVYRGGTIPEGNTAVWDEHCRFAVQAFPFPDRMREMIPIKYLNQTNFQLGADTASGSVDMTIRYAFNQKTASMLERWSWVTSNPHSGGVGLTSSIKTNGYFWWLVPNQAVVANTDNLSDGVAEIQSGQGGVMTFGGAYKLEGCMVKNLKPSDADMTSSDGLVTLAFGLQIDRYYPINPDDLQKVTVINNFTNAVPPTNQA